MTMLQDQQRVAVKSPFVFQRSRHELPLPPASGPCIYKNPPSARNSGSLGGSIRILDLSGQTRQRPWKGHESRQG